MTLTPKPGILEITPYIGGRASVAGVEKVIKLSSNESPLGPSPMAVEALVKASRDLELYPEGSAKILREAIGEVYGLDPARIVASGDGSDALLTMLANAYLRPCDEVLFGAHDFILYKIATLANRAIPIEVPDPKLRRRDDGVWEYTEPDWDELRHVVTGHGPMTEERLAFRRRFLEQEQWVRDAVAAA